MPQLKKCIVVLVKLRTTYRNQLDARTLEELDDLIAEFQAVGMSGLSEQRRAMFATRFYQIADIVLRLATNLNDWLL